MGQTVYADLLFLINFSMDFLCYYITSKLMHRKLPSVRAIIASAIGGVYAVLILLSGVVPPLELVCNIIAGVIMCIIVFAKKGTRPGRVLLSSLVYVGVSVALGGLMTAIFNMLNLLGLPLGSIEESGDGIPVWLFAILAAVSGTATLAGGRFFKKKQSQRTADVEITIKDKTVRLSAILDSGNLLRDPISGKSVIVTDIVRMKDALPSELIRAVKEKDPSRLSSLDRDSSKRLHLIPSRTAHGEGMLYAMKPDRMTICNGKDKREVDALFAPVVLDGTAHGFDALLPSELMI